MALAIIATPEYAGADEAFTFTIFKLNYMRSCLSRRKYHPHATSISISIYSFKVQLTHRNMITKIKQMIKKKKNDKENRSTATESV